MEGTKLPVLHQQALQDVRAHGHAMAELDRMTLGRIADVISTAISYGVPLYNEGGPEYCYSVYREVAIQVQAVPDEAIEAMEERARIAFDSLVDALRRAEVIDDESDAAWTMRHAFDRIMARFHAEDSHVRKLVELGQAAFARGDFEGAVATYAEGVDAFNELAGVDEEDAPAAWRVGMLLLGHARFAIGDYAGAVNDLRRGMQLVSDWTDSGIDMRRQYLHPEQFDQQLEALGDHVADNAQDGDARFLYGYVHFFCGETAKASTILRHHLQLSPEDAESAFLLGAAMVDE